MDNNNLELNNQTQADKSAATSQLDQPKTNQAQLQTKSYNPTLAVIIASLCLLVLFVILIYGYLKK